MSPTTPPSIAPWLAVGDAQKAVDYYKAAFGAVELYRLPADDGTLAVAQLSVGGAVFWIQTDSNASPSGRGDGSVDRQNHTHRRSMKSTAGERGASGTRLATIGR